MKIPFTREFESEVDGVTRCEYATTEAQRTGTSYSHRVSSASSHRSKTLRLAFASTKAHRNSALNRREPSILSPNPVCT
jgi:hypothetical protein